LNPFSESDLQSYVDNRMDPARRQEVETYLSSHPAERLRLESYRKQNESLQALFNPVMTEPIPLALHAVLRNKGFRFSKWIPYGAVAGWVLMGSILGWMLHGSGLAPQDAMASLPRQAAMAYVVYSPEVLHPVEVGADQEDHLVKWLSRRLNTPIRIPRLGEAGYQLMGGRLLPGNDGAAAQFMYQDAKGQRLTLYVRSQVHDNHQTAFRYEREGNVGVFYWLDGSLGYALSGEMEKAQLLKVANVVYHQLNP
jgi:anti-sigma factor RsiW